VASLALVLGLLRVSRAPLCAVRTFGATTRPFDAGAAFGGSTWATHVALWGAATLCMHSSGRTASRACAGVPSAASRAFTAGGSLCRCVASIGGKRSRDRRNQDASHCCTPCRLSLQGTL